MADAPEPVDWVALCRVLDGTAEPNTLTGETDLEYHRILSAAVDAEPVEPDPENLAIDAMHAEVNQYIADVAADMEAKGIDPNGPESHAYYQAIEALRP